MYPTLVEFGPLKLHAYGFMLAVSFFFGILLAARRAPARRIPADVVFDTALVIVFASILGSRLMYVFFHMEEVHSFLDVVAVWRGGLTMYGGVLAAMAAAGLYVRRRKVPFLRLADVMAPSLGLGLMLTRLGCFLNGCCYGKPTDSALGVQFPVETLVGRVFEESALHPTQLYSAATGLFILGLLLLLDRGRRPEGQLFALYLMLDGIGRFALDFFRYYEANVYVLGELTVNQLISIGLFLLGVLLLVYTRQMPSARVPGWSAASHGGQPVPARSAR
ncbi:MAG: prolipoprotein diacylglyceryl transferase [Candidatus Krumholzibacteriia bacterium]